MPYRHPPRSRVWTRIRKHIRVHADTGCWEWTGAMSPGGYGVLRLYGKTGVAHRQIWVFLRNPDPGRLDLDHLCRNRACVNPKHLEIVTRSTNLRRGFEARGCLNGHPFSDATFSLVRRSNGVVERRCKVCHAARNRKTKTDAA